MKVKTNAKKFSVFTYTVKSLFIEPR